MLETSTINLLDRNENKTKFNFEYLFYVSLALIYAIVFLRITFGVDIPVIIILALYALTAFFASKRQLIALLVCCIPLYSAFQFKYGILIGIIIYLIKFAEGVKPKRVWIPFLLLMVWELVHVFAYKFSISEYLRSFSELILLTFIVTIPLKKLDFGYIIRTFAFACVGIMVILLFSLLRKYNFDLSELFSGKYYRLGSSETDFSNFAVKFNPNALGFVANLAMVLEAQILLSKKGKWFDYVLIAILLAFGVMTLSRTFLVCFGVMLILVVITMATKVSIKKTIIFSLITIIGLGLVILAIYLISPIIITNFLKRFGANDISNGRIGIFKFYNEGFFTNPKNYLLGMGLQNIKERIPLFYGANRNVPHNAIQELYVLFGIPCFLTFCLYIF